MTEETTEVKPDTVAPETQSDVTPESTANPEVVEDTTKGSESTESIETYADFTLPDGMQLDTAALERAQPIFKELGLSQEQAQKLVDFHASEKQAGIDAQQQAFEKIRDDWETETRSDPEIGGEKLDQATKESSIALTKYGNEKFVEFIEDSGIGNNVEFIRFMAWAGRSFKEDVPGATGEAGQGTKDRVSIMYPTSQ